MVDLRELIPDTSHRFVAYKCENMHYLGRGCLVAAYELPCLNGLAMLFQAFEVDTWQATKNVMCVSIDVFLELQVGVIIGVKTIIDPLHVIRYPWCFRV